MTLLASLAFYLALAVIAALPVLYFVLIAGVVFNAWHEHRRFQRVEQIKRRLEY